MRKAVIIIFFVFVTLTVFAQQNEYKLILTADLSNLKEQPSKVVIERIGLGMYGSETDTIKIEGKLFNYATQLPEPELLKIVFYWRNRKLTSTSFWAVSATYQLVFDGEFKPGVANVDQLQFSTKIKDLENQATKYRALADSLAGNVSYENQTIAAVEKRISLIRDSIDFVIDEQVYKKNILAHLDSPLGLYALYKYAERPYANQRIKSQPKAIQQLLDQFNVSLTQMPSAKILQQKLELADQMKIGKAFKVISLPDTQGKLVKISDFKGRYVLVDFWASWCTPCREENPALIKAFQKYKTAGFQIVGVSRDKKAAKTSWLKAIADDHINIWPQLSDFDNLAVTTYDIRFLPTNYLIDPKGIIIARDLRGDDLAKELKTIFKY